MLKFFDLSQMADPGLPDDLKAAVERVDERDTASRTNQPKSGKTLGESYRLDETTLRRKYQPPRTPPRPPKDS